MEIKPNGTPYKTSVAQRRASLRYAQKTNYASQWNNYYKKVRQGFFRTPEYRVWQTERLHKHPEWWTKKK